MHRTDEKKPTGSSNFTAGGTGTPTVSDTTGTDKAFTALAGRTLRSSSRADSAGIYYAARWGMSRTLLDLQAAALFLAQIGGQL